MSKFQEEYSIAHQSFEDFILVIYVLIDDFYKKVAPECVKYRPNVDKALLSDSEIITIRLCGEIVGVDYENAWYSFVKKNLRHLFPRFCKLFRAEGATYSKNPSKKQTYFGFKVHSITTSAGQSKFLR